MVLPILLKKLGKAYAFFTLQDSDSADSRFIKLKTELREMISVVSWSPGSCRPARFLNARSAQAQIRAKSVLLQAESADLPFLREGIVRQHIVLYAHSENEVVLLAPKHQSQLTYYADQ